MTNLTTKSKFLSFILRHKPEAANLTLDKNGWCEISELVSNTDISEKELFEIVESDKKQRYSIHETKVRANQGHSTSKVDLNFEKSVPPVVLYHGTEKSKVSLILKSGLMPMSRHYVHLSADFDTAVQVGSRRKEFEVLIIDAKKMVDDKITFFKSVNGIWLVNHVPPKYIKRGT